jgi:hypothetical protein
MTGNVAACVELQRGVFVRIARVMEDPTQRAKALRFGERGEPPCATRPTNWIA